MVRNVLGSLIALIGAAAAVWSPFRPWYDGRHGIDFRIEDLFHGLTGNGAALFGSLLLPMAFAALLTLIGVALRSRLLVTLAGLVVLGFTVLWMVRQGQAATELTAGARGLGVGVANALGGGFLLLLGALIMRGRGRRVLDRDEGGRGYDDRGYDDRGYDDRRHDDRGYDDGYYARPPYDARYDAPTRYDRDTPYPPGLPEPWDEGRPGAEEWNPEPYTTGPAPAGPPAGPAHTGHGAGAHGPGDDTPTAPQPVTPPPPPTRQQTPPQPQQPQQPQPPPPPTMPAHRQPPTPPVEWGREHRQQRPQEPGQGAPQEPQPRQEPEQPPRQEPEQPPEDRQ
ncbi:hypothetical protein [Streptomyces kronopolitis]